MFRLGFTGSREGMGDMQAQFVFNELMDLSVDEAHHGMCIGADALFDEMLAYTHAKVHGHPSNLKAMRARCEMVDIEHEPKPPLDRNRDIVDASDWLIAAPNGPEAQRSGTWSTIRYARKLGRPITIVWPDARITRENMPSRLPAPFFGGMKGERARRSRPDLLGSLNVAGGSRGTLLRQPEPSPVERRARVNWRCRRTMLRSGGKPLPPRCTYAPALSPDFDASTMADPPASSLLPSASDKQRPS